MMPYSGSRKIIVVACGAFVALLFFVSRGATAATTTPVEVKAIQDELAARRQRIEQLNKQIDEFNRQIEEKRKETATLAGQLGILENRIAKTHLDIEETKEEIASTELLIENLALAIAEKNQGIDAGKGTIAEYLRVIARRSDVSDLEVLIMHDRFSDYFDEVNFMEQINGSLYEEVKSLRALKEGMEAQKAAQEDKKKELAAFEERLKSAEEELAERLGAKEALYAVAQESEATLRRDREKLRAEQQQIDNEIVSLENTIRRRLRENDRFQGIAGDTVLAWPVPFKAITTYFHDPDYPFRYVFEHPGLDLRAGQGTPVKAAAPGFVARTKNGGATGYSFVMIIHQNGLSTVYGHVSQILVKEDDFVERGAVVALSGGLPGTQGAGRLTTGPHLHFEVRLNGIPVNPLEYLPH